MLDNQPTSPPKDRGCGTRENWRGGGEILAPSGSRAQSAGLYRVRSDTSGYPLRDSGSMSAGSHRLTIALNYEPVSRERLRITLYFCFVGCWVKHTI